MTTLLADGSRAVFGEVTPERVRGQDAPARAGRADLPRDRPDPRRSTTTEIRDALSEALAPGLRLQPERAGARIGRSTWRGSSWAPRAPSSRCVEAKMRLVKRPKATAVDVIHYHDMQEALESSQSILETGPYAVELTDKMILDLARMNIEQAGRMGFVQGDPAAILMVEYAGDTEAGGQGQGRGRSRRGGTRERFGYASHIASDAGRAAVDLEAAQGRPRPAAGHAAATTSRSPSSRTPRWTRSTCPSSCRASREIFAQARGGRRLLRPLLGRLPAHPPADQPEDRARPRAGPGDRRRDHRPRARVRRHHLQRARRRPRAQPVPRADVRADA